VLPRVRVTHPFHSSARRELEFVKRRNNWRADRVYMRGDAGELVSLLAEWTDPVREDPFVVVARGRAPFHLEGLLALSELVASLAGLCSQPAARPGSAAAISARGKPRPHDAGRIRRPRDHYSATTAARIGPAAA